MILKPSRVVAGNLAKSYPATAHVDLMRYLILVTLVLTSVLGCDTETETMKVFWHESGRGLDPDSAKEVDLAEAGFIWSDEVRGVQGNFFGLIDDDGRTIQFYFDDGIPDDVDDASHLRIVRMDFPMPEMNGSDGTLVTIGEVHGLIQKAFDVGADHRQFDGVTFTKW